MAEVTREPYVFSIEGECLRVSVGAVEVARAALSQASCEEGRYYVIFTTLLMNANFSAEEWDVLNGRALAAVEEVAPEVVEQVEEAISEVVEPVVAEESVVVTPVAPTALKRRRTF